MIQASGDVSTACVSGRVLPLQSGFADLTKIRKHDPADSISHDNLTDHLRSILNSFILYTMPGMQNCPVCSAVVEPSVRYKNYVCHECAARAVDENGRPLGFGNESISGGFVAWYKDTNETREGHICFIDGIKCRADEAHMGGIVINIYRGENE